MSQSLWIGLQLTVFGMGLVFLLLGALWGMMALMIKFDRPAVEEQAAPDEPATSTQATAQELDPDKIAAITVAVLTHVAVRRKQAAPAMRMHQPGTLPSRWLGTGRTRQNATWRSPRR